MSEKIDIKPVRDSNGPGISQTALVRGKGILKPAPEDWTDYCDEHVMLLRSLPALAGNAFECLKIVSHPDEDGTVSVLHEMIFMDDYTKGNCRGETELNQILSGFGYASLDDYVRDNNGDDDWVYHEDNSVDRDASPSWYINFEDLASLICESHDYGLKMTPEDAQHAVYRIVGKDYSLDWFIELAGASVVFNKDSFEHRLYNASMHKHESFSAPAAPVSQRELEL